MSDDLTLSFGEVAKELNADVRSTGYQGVLPGTDDEAQALCRDQLAKMASERRLTADEAATLASMEAIVSRGRLAFIEVGTALARIRDERLYRATHPLFADYLKERWGLSRSGGYEIISAAETAQVMSGIPDTPPVENIGQAVAVQKIIRDHGTDVAAQAMRDAATGGKVTATAIREKVKPRRRPLPDVYRETTYDVAKLAERLERLTSDDRMPQHREHLQVGDLQRAIRTMKRVHDRLAVVQVGLDDEGNIDDPTWNAMFDAVRTHLDQMLVSLRTRFPGGVDLALIDDMLNAAMDRLREDSQQVTP